MVARRTSEQLSLVKERENNAGMLGVEGLGWWLLVVVMLVDCCSLLLVVVFPFSHFGNRVSCLLLLCLLLLCCVVAVL